jgi:hypothetical protein
LLAKMETERDDYEGGETAYERFYEDYRTIDGMKCATRERVMQDGKIIDESHITKLKRSERLDDKLFVEPP